MNKKDIYNYLLRNNIAYFYANFTNDKSATAKKVIKAGNVLNKKFINTCDLINKISKEKDLEVVYFKTHKHFPEIVDNDIDLLIGEKNINKFIAALKKHGFKCLEETKNKYVCKNEKYLKIEPRVDTQLAKYTKKEDGIKYTTETIDGLYFIYNFLYGPNYLNLYKFFIIDSSLNKIKKLSVKFNLEKEILYFEKVLNRKIKNKAHFPLFLKNLEYLYFFINFLLLNKSFSLVFKLRHFAFFFFFKYKYVLFDKLHFEKKWPINL